MTGNIAHSLNIVTCLAYFGLVFVHVDWQREQRLISEELHHKLASASYSILAVAKVAYLFTQ